MRQIWVILILLATLQAKAQQFDATIRFIPNGWQGEITKVDNTKLKGVVAGAKFEENMLTEVTLTSDNGSEEVLEASDILKFNTQGITFDQHTLPGNKRKLVLLQLLNSKFGDQLKVYLDPEAQYYQHDKRILYYSYYYCMGDQVQVEAIKQSNFDKVAKEVFGNCPLITGSSDLLPADEWEFVYDELESYLWYYNEYYHNELLVNEGE